MARKILKTVFILVGIAVFAALALIAYLTLTEYKPDDIEPVEPVGTVSEKSLCSGESISILSWNIGYAGLDKNADFFMDGGKGVRTASRESVRNNLSGIRELADGLAPDFFFFQEVDSDSKRTYGIDERACLPDGICAYALNYSCPYVPFPLPTIGKVNSGLYTVHSRSISSAERVKLPCPFSWPVSTANLKRCLLVSRINLADSERELVLINLHLEAYDNGEGKAAQTKVLEDLMLREYEAGNYVIAGGDFNQVFPDSLDKYPIIDPELWTPGVLEKGILSEKWLLAYDLSVPSCRLLNRAYSPSDPATQYYVIDGFILSPNIRLNSVETIDAGFEYSDHNPIFLSITLM